ncbi:hypothetical protein ASD79_17040 [Caulobacter sp. Root655]|uniref:hypothetical protein n=1 Tax=Caulobacter sp. Root655 TaxID=1736578 RepID=UPI0006F68C22|nr:hypothetical protein [Caulobacter sp. Root655]KRA56765.1 hypothetical protein ASD79_17040 [Caulobacter sp. Root655]
MMLKTLAAGAALAMLVSGAASAAPKAKASAAVAAPKQPIPYAQLDAYLKASPKARANTDWWSGSASTGMSADTSATMPAAPTTPDGAVNPPTSSTMPTEPAPAMPATPPTMPDATTPAPGSNLPDTTIPPGAPTEPK